VLVIEMDDDLLQRASYFYLVRLAWTY